MSKQRTLNEFQTDTIQRLQTDKESTALDLIYESAEILSIIRELNNDTAEITPTGFRDIQIALGNALKDICVLAENFGYSLEYIADMGGRTKLKGFAYFSGKDYDISRKEHEKGIERRKREKTEIAIMPEIKKQTGKVSSEEW